MLFNIDIPKILNNALGPLVLSATLTKVSRSGRVDGSLTAGLTQTPTNYSCKGFVDNFRDGEIDGSLVKAGDRKVILLGASISGGSVRPEIGDIITIESETRSVVRVTRDPAAATYTCQVR